MNQKQSQSKTNSSSSHTTQMRVILKPEVHAKVMTWVRNCDIECSGVGKVQQLGNGVFLVTEALLLKQEGDAVATRLDPDDIGKAMYETRDSDGDLTWWWHSHVDMGTFWSKTDSDSIHELSDKGYCLATVFNKQGSMLSAFEMSNHELLPDMMVDRLPTTVQHVPRQSDIEAWKKELKEKVKETVNTVVYGGYQGNAWRNQGPKWWDYRVLIVGDWKWVWELNKAHKDYATLEEVVAEYGSDPSGGNRKASGAYTNKKKDTGKAATKVAGTTVNKDEATLTNCPLKYVTHSKKIPLVKVREVYEDYTKYFKDVPTLEELDEFYELNKDDFYAEEEEVE